MAKITFTEYSFAFKAIAVHTCAGDLRKSPAQLRYSVKLTIALAEIAPKHVPRAMLSVSPVVLVYINDRRA